MQRYLEELYARLSRQSVEKLNRYSPDEIAGRRQAGEWINWPLYITQPIIPLLFQFLDFADVVFVIAVLLVVNVIWIRIVSQRFVSLELSRLGDSVAVLKWLASPLAALMLWQQGNAFAAAAALTWPILLINVLFALHRFWPNGALANTQHMFQVAAKRKPPRQ